jgi:tetratricopeptide (TPR) repeat protein
MFSIESLSLLSLMLLGLGVLRIVWHFWQREFRPMEHLRQQMHRQFFTHRFPQAATLLHRTLPQLIEAFEIESPLVMEAMAYLARVYQRYGHRSMARRLVEPGARYLHDHPVESRGGTSGMDRSHLRLAQVVAFALCETGSLGDGLDLLRQVRAWTLNFYGEESEELAEVLSFRAQYLIRLGRAEEASQDLKQALYIRDQKWGTPSAMKVDGWIQFAEADAAKGEFEHARGALRLVETPFAGSRNRTMILLAKAMIAEKQQNLAEALELLEDAQAIAPRRDRYLRASIFDQQSNLLFRLKQTEAATSKRIRATQMRGEIKPFPIHLLLALSRQSI